MTRWKPSHAILIVLVVLGFGWGIRLALDAHHGKARLETVRADSQGVVRIDLRDLERLEVRFFRFINAGNQEVEFLVGRDEEGEVQVGFNANDNHYKTRRGFSFQDGWIIDNKCETATRLSKVNAGGGGCKPAPLEHQVLDDVLVLQERDLLAGWRYFR